MQAVTQARRMTVIGAVAEFVVVVAYNLLHGVVLAQMLWRHCLRAPESGSSL